MVVTVKNARRGKLRLAYGVQLSPGLTQVDSGAWERCRGHPVTLHYIQRGEVSIVPGSAGVVPSVQEPAIIEADPVTTLPLPLPEFAPTQDLPSVRATTDDDIPASATRHPETMRAKDAALEVRNYQSIVDLEDLLRIESRSTVVKAIRKRIAELEG